MPDGLCRYLQQSLQTCSKDQCVRWSSDGLENKLFNSKALLKSRKGKHSERFKEVYFAQWPECRKHMNWPEITYFVVRPEWIRYTDYDQEPPLIQEIAKEALAYDF